MSLISEVKKTVVAAKKVIKPIKYTILTSSDNNAYYVFTVKDKYVNVIVYTSPFANCQLCTMSPVANLLATKDTDMIKALLKVIYGTVQKRMFAIDMQKNYEVSILERLQPYISSVNKTDYLSSNGSAMVMCVFRLNEESLK